MAQTSGDGKMTAESFPKQASLVSLRSSAIFFLPLKGGGKMAELRKKNPQVADIDFCVVGFASYDFGP